MITPRVTFVKKHPTSGGLQVGQKVVVRVGVAAVSVAELNAAIADLEAQIAAIEAGTIPESVATDLADLKTRVAALEEAVAELEESGGGGTSDEVTSAIEALQAADVTITANLAAEALERSTADADLDAALVSAISSEASTRAAADAALGERITAESSARTSADTALGTQITDEATSRAAADTTLTSNLAAEVSARQSADSALTTALAAKADLVGGKVPASQIPGAYDDVLEYAGVANFPATGEAGVIYVDTATNLTYRWSGSTYATLDPSLALGETSATAYRGDRGAVAYAAAVGQAAAIATAKAEAIAASEPAIAKSDGILSWAGSAWAWLTGIAWSLLTGIPAVITSIITAGGFKTINGSSILGTGDLTITGGSSSSTAKSLGARYEAMEHFVGSLRTLSFAMGMRASTEGGASVSQTSISGWHGAGLMSTGTTASSYQGVSIGVSESVLSLSSTGDKRLITRIKPISAQADSTLTGTLGFGFLDGFGSGIINAGMTWTSGGYLVCKTSTATWTSPSVLYVAGTEYLLEIRVPSGGATMSFYLDGVLLTTLANTTDLTGFGLVNFRYSATGTAITTAVDFLALSLESSTGNPFWEAAS